MKKAKIMISALGVLAILSGSLAFKASKTNGNLFATTVHGGPVISTQRYTADATSTLQLWVSTESTGTGAISEKVELDN